MDSNQLEQLHDALFGLCQAQAGKAQALEIVVRAVIASIVAQSPETSDAFQGLIRGMADESRSSVDSESLVAFDSTIESMTDLIDAIAKHHG